MKKENQSRFYLIVAGIFLILSAIIVPYLTGGFSIIRYYGLVFAQPKRFLNHLWYGSFEWLLLLLTGITLLFCQNKKVIGSLLAFETLNRVLKTIAAFSNLRGYNLSSSQIRPVIQVGITVIAWALLTFYCFTENRKKNWYFPAALLFLSKFISPLPTSIYFLQSFLRNFPNFGFTAISLLSIGMWLNDVALPKKVSQFLSSLNPPKQASCDLPKQTIHANTSNAPASEAYCDLVKHILLLLFTCGIWLLIWIYRMTGYTNAVKDEEERNPTNKLLLCLFVPFYFIFWTYKTAQRIDKMATEKGVSSDITTLCLILAIFVPVIPPILMQEKMNTIITATSTQTSKAQATTNQNTQTAPVSTTEELKNYKELLDTGVITQEEFDAKKKQLLGL